jgi:hypothetical protein
MDGRMKKRVAKKRKATYAVATWPSVYKPRQKVRVRHNRWGEFVPAILVRKKYGPAGAWICRKKIQGHWTKASVVNEIYFQKEDK